MRCSAVVYAGVLSARRLFAQRSIDRCKTALVRRYIVCAGRFQHNQLQQRGRDHM